METTRGRCAEPFCGHVSGGASKPGVAPAWEGVLAHQLDAHAAGKLALGELLRSTVQGGRLRRLLIELLASPGQMRSLAARSYQHGNGFTKFELLSHGGYKVRLHGWLPGVAAEENIHDHRWGFASMILAGQLCSEAFLDDALGELTCTEYAYSSRQQGKAAGKERIGEARLRPLGRQIREAGDVYAMKPAELHRICISGRELIATLMISEPPLAGGSRLLVESSRAIDPDVTAQPLDLSFATSTLQTLLSHLPEEQS